MTPLWWVLVQKLAEGRYSKCQGSIVFYFLSPQFRAFWRLVILCLNIVDTNRAFLVHYVSKYVEFNQAIDGVFEKHRRANIIMDSHSVIFSCFFHEHLHITLTLPNPLLQLSSWEVLCYDFQRNRQWQLFSYCPSLCFLTWARPLTR